jgi:hypothetical protein
VAFREGRSIKLGEYVVFGKVPVFEQVSLPEHIDILEILKKLDRTIPAHLVEDLDVIYIGDFDFLGERDLNAMYQDGAIYVSAQQDDEDDLIDDIVHEIAHCVEETYTDQVYGDGDIEDEFLIKRKKLLDILRREGYNVSLGDFLEIEYSKEFDEFLYIEVGYPVLAGLTMGLFVSPYGATSLREYFANAFEEMFAKRNPDVVRKISPAVYKTVNNLLT